MLEIWRNIVGFDGLYQVSNLGRVKSLKNRHGKVQLLKAKIKKNGYCEVALFKNGKYKFCLVHRLVAIHFIPNPNNYPEINHKDENPLNNCVDNLEWCSRQYNINYGSRNAKVSEKAKQYKHTLGKHWSSNHCGAKNHNSKPVEQYDLNGNFINRFDCIADAEKHLGFKPYTTHIGGACNGRLNQSCGFKWKWVS